MKVQVQACLPDRASDTLLSAGLAPASAQSVGVYRGAAGAKDASMASAGSALGTTPVAALSWNPAGLASLDQPEVDVALAALSARGTFANRVDSNGFLRDAQGVVPDGAVAFPLQHGSVRGRRWPAEPTERLPDRGSISDVPGAAGATYGLATHRSGVIVLRPTAGLGARLGSRRVGGRQRLDAVESQRAELALHFPDAGAARRPQDHARRRGQRHRVERQPRRCGQSQPRPSPPAVSWRSSTTLTTNGEATGDAWAQFAAAGIAADSKFAYSAAVRNSFPSMVAAAASSSRGGRP